MVVKLGYKRVVFLLSLFFILIILPFGFLADISVTQEILYLMCVITLIFDVLVMFCLFKTHGTILKITILFSAMFILFMHGQVILYVFGLTTDGFLLSNKFTPLEIIFGLMVVNIFWAVFLMAITSTKTYVRLHNKKGNFEFEDNRLVKAGIIVMLCSLPFELYVNISKLFFAFSYGYASLYQDVALESISSGYKILSYFYLPGCFYILFGSKRGSKGEKLAWGLILIHAIIEMMIGYRASAMIPIIIILYSLHVKISFSESRKQNRKTKKIIIRSCIIAMIVVVFVFPIVRLTRNSGGITMEAFLQAFSFESYRGLFTTINDMGKSLQTVIYTCILIPEQYSYRYGVTYLMNLTQIIPNFFWTRHPAEVYGSLGKWLTKIVDPSFYQFGGALGFSCVAEAYINFGYIGIVVFPFIFGKILQTVENRIDSSAKPVNYASFCIVSVYLMSYARGEFTDLVRGFFWYMMIPYIFYKYFVKRGLK